MLLMMMMIKCNMLCIVMFTMRPLVFASYLLLLPHSVAVRYQRVLHGPLFTKRYLYQHQRLFHLSM